MTKYQLIRYQAAQEFTLLHRPAPVNHRCWSCDEEVWAGNPMSLYLGHLICLDCGRRKENEFRDKRIASVLGITGLKEAYAFEEIDDERLEHLLGLALADDD